MNIYIQNHIGCNHFKEFLDVNRVDYEVCDLYQEIEGLNYPILPSDTERNIFVINSDTLLNMLVTDIGYNSLVQCLNNNNIVLMPEFFDAIQHLRNTENILLKLDSDIPKQSLVIFWDTHFVDCLNFKNIEQQIVETCHEWLFPRITGSFIKKNLEPKDFLITARIKHGRPHRNLLRESFNNSVILKDKGIVNFLEADTTADFWNTTEWIGEIAVYHCPSYQPSMDLYRNCYFEIVSETYIEKYFLTTEKTLKSIWTKTPFLVQSTPGYLKYIKNTYGLKTFNQLINEDYDAIENDIDRTKRIINIAEDIVTNGSKDFYDQASDILDHNFKRAAEISGLYNFNFDQIYQTWLNHSVSYCK